MTLTQESTALTTLGIWHVNAQILCGVLLRSSSVTDFAYFNLVPSWL